MIKKTKTTLGAFGIGSKKIIARGIETTGRVIQITPCEWLKINTKPFRAHAWDGSVYPNMVHFQYAVNGQVFSGKRYWPWALTPPAIGATISVSYDPQNPEKWAVDPNNP